MTLSTYDRTSSIIEDSTEGNAIGSLGGMAPAASARSVVKRTMDVIESLSITEDSAEVKPVESLGGIAPPASARSFAKRTMDLAGSLLGLILLFPLLALIAVLVRWIRGGPSCSARSGWAWVVGCSVA